jgi:hypothetical protein
VELMEAGEKIESSERQQFLDLAYAEEKKLGT